MPLLPTPASSWLYRFARDERGAISVWSLFLFLTACALGGLALDVTSMFAMRTQLQVAADVAAHAAVFRRHNGATEDEAKADAILVASATVPPEVYGDVINASDIVFGTYDADTDTFTEVEDSTDAVFVRAERQEDRGNQVATLMLRMAGIESMDVGASAVYVSDGDPCSSLQGLFGNGDVNPESNNTYSGETCVHSNAQILFNQNNSFDLESHVSAPSLSQISCSGNAGNIDAKCPNLTKVWDEGTYDLTPYYDPLQGATTGPALLAQVDQVMALMPTWSWTGINRTVNTVTGTSLAASASTTNRVTYVNCNGGNLTLSGTFTNAVLLLNNCRVQVNSNQTLSLSDTVLYNTNTNDHTAFNFGSGNNAARLALGTDTDCDGTGSAFLLTRGGFDAPAKMTLNNGTIVARGDVKFAAQFGGANAQAKGLSVIARGEIDTTSNSTFTACPPLPSTPPTLVTYRLAR